MQGLSSTDHWKLLAEACAQIGGIVDPREDLAPVMYAYLYTSALNQVCVTPMLVEASTWVRGVLLFRVADQYNLPH